MKGSPALAVVLWLLGAVALGQPAPDPEAVKSASARYHVGATYFEAHSYHQAITEFEASFALVPHPLMLFNIAEARRKLSEPRTALVYYWKYVTAAPDGARVREARHWIVEFSRRLKLDPSVPPVAERSEPAPAAAPVATTAVAAPAPPPPAPVASPAPAPSNAASSSPAVATPAPAASAAIPREATPSRPIARRPGTWVAVGAVLLVLGAGGVTAGVLASPRYASPPTDLAPIGVSR